MNSSKREVSRWNCLGQIESSQYRLRVHRSYKPWCLLPAQGQPEQNEPVSQTRIWYFASTTQAEVHKMNTGVSLNEKIPVGILSHTWTQLGLSVACRRDGTLACNIGGRGVQKKIFLSERVIIYSNVALALSAGFSFESVFLDFS